MNVRELITALEWLANDYGSPYIVGDPDDA